MEKKVLIVEDAPFMRMMISDILKKNGYQIVGEAGDGKKGIEKYMELKPDLVIMDITMPEMDGLEATKAILAKDPSAIIVMCSRMGQEAIIMEAIRIGAKEFIVKPFKPETVLSKVAKALQ